MKPLLALLVCAVPTALAASPEALETPALGNLWADLLILVGCVFLLTAAIGMARFPDFYTRLHASSKLVTLGGVGFFGGAAIAFAPLGITQRILLIAAFFLLTAPLSGYMIARAGYLRGLPFYREADTVDEWGAHGAAVPKSEVPDAEKEALS